MPCGVDGCGIAAINIEINVALALPGVDAVDMRTLYPSKTIATDAILPYAAGQLSATALARLAHQSAAKWKN
jgi:hypothetical protein